MITLKSWRITAELFWSANHIEAIEVKANTERKAKIFAEQAFRKKYPDVKEMICIQKVERID